ncbi:MAG: hypothetical protein AAB929_01710 [Patescibacteria group bacterium]
MRRYIFETTIPVFSWFIAKIMALVLLVPLMLFGLIAISSMMNGGKFSDLTPDIYYASGLVGLLFLLTYVVMAVMFPNGFVSKIQMNESGVSQVSLSPTGKINRAAIIGGILTKSPEAIGAGLLAEAGDDRSIRWKDIKIMKINSNSRYMYFSRGKFTLFPIGFFCHEKNYKEVSAFISKYYKISEV